MKKIRKGFTLIEMVIVLFIISLLLLIMIPNLTAQRNNANEKSNKALETTIVNQAELYSENHPNEEVSIDKLKDKNYITDKQVERITKLKLTLKKDNQAEGWALVDAVSH